MMKRLILAVILLMPMAAVGQQPPQASQRDLFVMSLAQDALGAHAQVDSLLAQLSAAQDRTAALEAENKALKDAKPTVPPKPSPQ